MDLKRLINHYEMGAPYYGDVKTDTLALLQTIPDANENYCELEEIKTAFCAEDELEEISDLVKDIIEARMTKKAMLSDLGKLLEMIESKQLELSRQTEYACDLISSLSDRLTNK